jgi:phosphoribosylglycinamide formyltransferase-1
MVIPVSDQIRTVVLASGGGSNFQALVDHFRGVSSAADIVGLVASRTTSRVLERATRENIPCAVMSEFATHASDFETRFLTEVFDEWTPNLIVLAGYMRLIPPDIVKAQRGKIINVHPALLPSFGGSGMYGAHVHKAVIASGAKISGVTVHFVDEVYDRGPTIAQWPVPVRVDDTPQSLAARVLKVEHLLLPAVVEAFAEGQVSLGGRGRVEWTDEWFANERFTMEG